MRDGTVLACPCRWAWALSAGLGHVPQPRLSAWSSKSCEAVPGLYSTAQCKEERQRLTRDTVP